jgi:hypothetical protein
MHGTTMDPDDIRDDRRAGVNDSAGNKGWLV